MRNLLATAALAAALISPTPAQAKCLKLTDPKVQTEIDVLANKSGQSKAQIFSILDNFECSGVPRSQAFEDVMNTIRNMQDMRNNAPGSTAMREQMMAGLRGRDRAAMEQTFADLHRLANDNNLVGFLNRLKEKGEDIYRAHLERKDPSAPQFIATEREQAKTCTPERIAASAERAKDCAPEQSTAARAPEQSTAAPAQRPRTSPSPSATSGPAQNYTAKQFLDDYRNGSAEAQQLWALRAQSFQEGVMWANVYNEHEGRETAVLYCAPSKIVLQGEQVIDILRREVEVRPELAQQNWALAMMEALRMAFPCAAAKSVPAPEQSTAARAPEQSAPTPAPEQSTAAREPEQSTAAREPEQSTAAREPEQSTAAPAPEQPRGWIAEVKKSRPICASADDYVQFHRTSFDIARRPSNEAMQKAIEFVKRQCPIVMFEPGDHANVERTETFSIDKTRSIKLACVVIKDGPCAWTDASQLVRIPEEAPAKKPAKKRGKR